MPHNEPNVQLLLSLVHTPMPFGKYKNTLLCDLPEAYLLWFKQNGYPKGLLGEQLESLFEIKSNGANYILKELKNRFPKG